MKDEAGTLQSTGIGANLASLTPGGARKIVIVIH